MEPSTPSSTPKKSNPCSTPKGSIKSTLSRSKNTKNPYANRGLDKFSLLLADLEEKRRKIYTQMGSDNIALVRFVSSSTFNDVKPLIVKSKDKKQEKTNVGNVKNQHVNDSKDLDKVKVEKKRCRWMNVNLDIWKQPSYYLLVFIILILLFLAMFGRSFAISCTLLGWYLIPSVRGGILNFKRPKKNEYAKRLSDKRMIKSEQLSSPKVLSPTSATRGPVYGK